MKKINKNIWVTIGLSSLLAISCSDDIDPLITELETARVFAPTDLRANIRNQTTIELDWATKENVGEYVVEFFEDSLQFNTVIRTVSTTAEELPIQETFFGDTRYSIRVKALSADGSTPESSWATTTVRTDAENIYLPIEDGDILWDKITVRFPANSEVTRLVINPGNIERAISDAEKAAGVVTVDGLTGLTEYTVDLFSNNSKRGSSVITTLIDPTSPDLILLSPGDDIAAAVAGASAGQTIVLNPGDYAASSGTISINKAITIRGQYPYDRPILYNDFEMVTGAGNVAFLDLELNGDNGNVNTVIAFGDDDVEYGAISISGCYIHDYGRQLISGSGPIKLESFSVDNSIVKDFVGGGGDFIDFRNGHVSNLTLTNSTFVTTPLDRDFIRMDDSSDTYPGQTATVVIDQCTLYGISDINRRVFYVRFVDNSLTMTNTIIAETSAFFTREDNATQPALSNNNYFNAEGFHTSDYRGESGFKFDAGAFTTEDPGFVDAENGDFTVTNQTLLDNGVGDPRWR